MTPSRRRRSSERSQEPKRQKPDKDAAPPPDDELESLELLEEEEGNGEVRVTHELIGDGDVRLTVDVGDMEKAAVLDAVAPSLRSATEELAPQLRWRNVLVSFTGSALIPSAAKELVGSTMADARPLRVTVQRGYGDECVYEGSPPTVQWSARPDESYALKDLVEVDTGDLESADLAIALRPELEKAAAQAAGKAFEITFRGSATPDAGTLEELAVSLRNAGASRVALGGEEPVVLFDQILEDQIAITGGTPTKMEIQLKANPDETVQAMSLVLPRVRDQLSGRRVRARCSGRDPRGSEIAALLNHAADLQLERLELESEGGLALLWPALLTVDREGPTRTVSVDPGSRDRAAVHEALAREAGSLACISGCATTVDWPAGFELEGGLEAAMLEALSAHQPASISFTFAGAGREPVRPEPVALRDEGAGIVCELDTDTGKPAELVRAMLRRIPEASGTLQGRDVTVNILGSGAVSRTMRRTLEQQLQAAGVAGLSLRDEEMEDIVLPPLLSVDSGDDGLHVLVKLAGRDTEQIKRALARELESVECPHGATVSFAGEVTYAIAEVFLDKGAGRLLVEGQQVYPSLLAAPERDGNALTVRLAETPYPVEDPLPMLQSELPAILGSHSDLPEVSVTMVWPGTTADSSQMARVRELVSSAGAARLLFDDGSGTPVQLHPEPVQEEPVLEELEEEPVLEELPSEPAPPPAIVVLGRKDDATPPLIVLGIDWTDDATAAASVDPGLEAMAGELQGRRVLVTFRADGQDREGPADSVLVQAVRSALATKAAALLLYRAPGRGCPAHFEVVDSNVAELPRGMKVRDPRRSA